MNINFIINLNNDEKQRMTDQCIKEFKQADKSIECLNKKFKEIYDKTHTGVDWDTHLRGECAMNRIKEKRECKRMRKLAICDIALALDLIISDKVKRRSLYGAEYDRIGEEFCTFYEKFPPREERIDKGKPYYRKLAIYMMCRAGIITKGTRDRMIELTKTKTVMQLQERTQRKINKIQEAFVKFTREINGIVSPDEAKKIAKECGLHRYLVKKYGIEAVTAACVGK